MNKARRKELEKAIALLQSMEDTFNEAVGIIEGVRDEEREAFDNLSEGLQQSERGQRMEEAVDALDSLTDDLQQIDMSDLAERIRDSMQ